jgi:hypothetical protein
VPADAPAVDAAQVAASSSSSEVIKPEGELEVNSANANAEVGGNDEVAPAATESDVAEKKPVEAAGE